MLDFVKVCAVVLRGTPTYTVLLYHPSECWCAIGQVSVGRTFLPKYRDCRAVLFGRDVAAVVNKRRLFVPFLSQCYYSYFANVIEQMNMGDWLRKNMESVRGTKSTHQVAHPSVARSLAYQKHVVASTPWTPGGLLTKGPFRFHPATTQAQKRIIERMADFWTDELLRDVLKPHLCRGHAAGDGRYSLRDLDWLCTNFAKANHVVLQDKVTGKIVDIHASHDSMCESHTRRDFDVFRRGGTGTRVGFSVDGTDYETTVGQLNYLSWAYSHGIVDYCIKNIHEIRAHNGRTAAREKERKVHARDKGEGHMRRTLNQKNTRGIVVARLPLTICFGGPP